MVVPSELLVCLIFGLTCGSFYLPGKQYCKNYDDSTSEICGFPSFQLQTCLSCKKQCMLWVFTDVLMDLLEIIDAMWNLWHSQAEVMSPARKSWQEGK